MPCSYELEETLTKEAENVNFEIFRADDTEKDCWLALFLADILKSVIGRHYACGLNENK